MPISINNLMNTFSKENPLGAAAQLEKYLNANYPAGSRTKVLVRLLVEALDPLPGPAEDAIYAILCDKNNPLRKLVSSALTTQGTSIATTVLIAGLGSVVTGPVIGILAGIVVKLIAESADQDLSKEIQQARAAFQKDKKRQAEKPAASKPPAAKKPAPRQKPSAEAQRPSAEAKKPAKKPAGTAPKAAQRPAASSKGTAGSSTPRPSGQPTGKPAPAAKPKPAAKTAKKDKPEH